MTYSEKLRDPRWQKKRLEVLSRYAWKCAGCTRTDRTMHVHHRYYVSKRDPWEYPDFCLVALCDKCHDAATYPLPEFGLCFDGWELMIDELAGDASFLSVVDDHLTTVAAEIKHAVDSGIQRETIVAAILDAVMALRGATA